jgi:predicted PurR-regulated permease PerM
MVRPIDRGAKQLQALSQWQWVCTGKIGAANFLETESHTEFSCFSHARRVRGCMNRDGMKMSFPDRRTTNVVLSIAFFALLGMVVYSARRVLLIFVFAMFFAYLINPIVKFMQGRSLFFRNLRGRAVIEVYVALILITAALGYAFAPKVVVNTGKLVDEVPAVLDGLATGDLASHLAGEYGLSEATEVRFRTFLVRHRTSIENLAAEVDRFLVDGARVIGYLLLTPILAIFFLRDGDYIAKSLIHILFPPDRRAAVRAAAHELHAMLAKYMAAQVLLCTCSFVFYCFTLLALHTPHPIALAILGGLLEFIPIAGWLTMLAVVLSVALVSHSHWISVAILFGLWRVVQDYFLCPRILGRSLSIHPLAAIFAILVGAEVGGIVGVYLAIPFVASVRVVWHICAARGTSETMARHTIKGLSGAEQPVRPTAMVAAVPAHAKAE